MIVLPLFLGLFLAMHQVNDDLCRPHFGDVVPLLCEARSGAGWVPHAKPWAAPFEPLAFERDRQRRAAEARRVDGLLWGEP